MPARNRQICVYLNNCLKITGRTQFFNQNRNNLDAFNNRIMVSVYSVMYNIFQCFMWLFVGL